MKNVYKELCTDSIECIEMNIIFRSLTFLFKIYFYYSSYVIFEFLSFLIFEFSLSVSIIIKISRKKTWNISLYV